MPEKKNPTLFREMDQPFNDRKETEAVDVLDRTQEEQGAARMVSTMCLMAQLTQEIVNK